MNLIIIVLYNLALFGGVAYLVEYHYWSAWWFLFAVLVMGSHSSEKKDDKPI